MNTRNQNQLFRLIWAAFVTVVCMPVVSAQTNTFPSSGNAGVGTTNPSQKLEVSGGAIKITGGGLYVDNDQAIRAGGGDQSLVYRSSSNGIYFGSGDPNDFLVLNAGGAERLRVTTNGRAGLGTSSPLATFDVSNPTANLWSHWAHSTATTGQNYGILINAGTNSSDFSFRAQNASGSTELFAVRGDGNVGIGTASPSFPLHVSRSASDQYLGWFENTQSSPGTARLRVQNTAAQGSFEIDVLDNGNTYFQTGKSNNSPNLSILSGNVGIGTTSPYAKLHVSGGDINLDTGRVLRGGGEGIVGRWATATNQISLGSGVTTDYLVFLAGGSERLRVDASGNVGIGKSADSGYKLDVAGNINSTQTITGNNIVAKYQDVAEWVPSSEQLSAGTVVVLDSTKSNQVTSSSIAYDTRVAGVVSEQPGIALGEKGEGKVLVATTGRVRVQVDASRGPIHVGDLLVTSDILGVAMKSEPVNLGGVQLHRPGTLIGKALESLEKGKGTILVLLSLQ